MTLLITPDDEVIAPGAEGPRLFAHALALVDDGRDDLDAAAELIVATEGRRLPLLAAYNLGAALVEHFPNDQQAERAFTLLGRALKWGSRIELAG